ncbi:hypothetical protein [Actinomadura sp. 3N508]|uniref:hypothetical protein n=1 Tax=Actinomadura sp. 3N508 TaxID=3375153 RepID=UPI003788896D
MALAEKQCAEGTMVWSGDRLACTSASATAPCSFLLGALMAVPGVMAVPGAVWLLALRTEAITRSTTRAQIGVMNTTEPERHP